MHIFFQPSSRWVSLIALSVAVSACSSSLIDGQKIDYKSAKRVSTLEVPPDLVQPRRNGNYDIPGAEKEGTATFSDYAGQRNQQQHTGVATPRVLPQSDTMHIERAGQQRWLVVKAADSDQLWQQLREFWLDLGFFLNKDQPEIGVMETDWAENRAKIKQDFIRNSLGRVFDNLYSTGLRDKFRTRLDKGSVPDTYEIYVSHRGMEEVFSGRDKETTLWTPRATDTELEVEMLRRLMVSLGAQPDAAARETTQAAATDKAGAASSAEVRFDAQAQQLRINDSFDRAWRRVGLSLDRQGFTVEDRDRSQGVYYVRYIDPDADQRDNDGSLSWLAFWRDKNAGADSEGTQYQIKVSEAEQGSVVTVLNNKGIRETSETAQKILKVLEQQLQ